MQTVRQTEPQSAHGEGLSDWLAHLEGRVEREYGPARSHRAVSAAAASVDATQQVDDPAIFDMLESFIKKTQDEYSQHSVLPSFESADASTGLPTKAAEAKPNGAVKIGQQISYDDETEDSEQHTSEEFDSSYQPTNRHSSGPDQYQKPGKHHKSGKSDSESKESDQEYVQSDNNREMYVDKDSSDADGEQQEEEEEEGEENYFGKGQGKGYSGKAPGNEYGGRGKGKKAHIPVPKEIRPGMWEMVRL